MENLVIEMKKHNGCNWQKTTIANFLANVKATRELLLEIPDGKHNPDDYTEEKALWNIRTGRIVDTPILMFRLAEGEECPKCGTKFVQKFGALSRRDNKTYICSECGTREALEDMMKFI